MTEGFDAYAELIEKLVDAEASRKTALEQKAGAVITTSGTLVTLLFGLVAVLTTKQSYAVPPAAHAWLGGAVLLFTLAAVTAIYISVPRPYGQTEMTQSELRGHWSDPLIKARAAVASVRLQGLERARKTNTAKAKMLTAATGIEVVAVLTLAIAVLIMLRQAH
jgi:multisubunit Na+/H+ antiporter MnhB subunit